MSETLCRRLGERVAIVTGGASGIGRATALRLASEGASVVIADIQLQGAETTAAEIAAAGGSALAVACNVAEEDEVRHLVGRCIATYRRLDILANVAGISTRPKKPIDEITIEQFNQVLSINLAGTFLCIKHAAPFMKERRYGRIVNVASIAAFQSVNPGNSPYAASKGGVVALTRHAVADLSKFGITVNAVAPGIIKTAITDKYGPEWLENIIKPIPLGRLGEPEDIAAAIAFLASDDAGFFTGQLLVADGGMTSIVYHG